MVENRLQCGDVVVVTAKRSQYRGHEGEVRGWTGTKKSVRVRLEGIGERTLRVGSVKLKRRVVAGVQETKDLEKAVRKLVEELTDVMILVKQKLAKGQ